MSSPSCHRPAPQLSKSDLPFPRALSNEEPVIAALSVVTVTVGTAFAWIAGRHGRYQQAMEAFGGILLITGFALLGYELESVFGLCLP
jgi:hypothetical protein